MVSFDPSLPSFPPSSPSPLFPPNSSLPQLKDQQGASTFALYTRRCRKKEGAGLTKCVPNVVRSCVHSSQTQHHQSERKRSPR